MSASERITSVSVPEALERLEEGKWLVPPFQREFVWDVPAISALATSIIDGYPIGMMTLWNQPQEPDFDHLEQISLPDWDENDGKSINRQFTEQKANEPRAILDGRQRCTALAMLFGNFKQTDNRRKYSGSFFLDVTAIEPSERIAFKKSRELEKDNLRSVKACMAAGLFPLSSFDNKPITEQWMDYLESLGDTHIYPENEVPDREEMDRRRKILREAYKGIFQSTIAVYTVPADYDLGRICDIFETLNQTGVKVSTVDLIHSWILTETTKEGEPLSVRDWLDEASELPGAIGWISSEKRPELTAQLVTACYVARANKPEPPRKTKGKRKEIRSVKSPDLLNTPKSHWRQIVSRQDSFAKYLLDFQNLVAGGSFSSDRCPYPVSSAVYVGLRWHLDQDYPGGDAVWSKVELNCLYKAFFWRNALSGRYDQGFLTTLGADINEIKNILETRDEFSNTPDWISTSSARLERYLDKEVPSKERLIDILLNGRPGGAMQSALQLPMIAATRHDIGGESLEKGKPLQIHLHHIYPRKWCKNNASGEFSVILDPKRGPVDYANSISNLMPLSPKTNQDWRDMSPGAYIESRNISFDSAKDALEKVYIDEELFDLLKQDRSKAKDFWEMRADKIADHMLTLTQISL